MFLWWHYYLAYLTNSLALKKISLCVGRYRVCKKRTRQVASWTSRIWSVCQGERISRNEEQAVTFSYWRKVRAHKVLLMLSFIIIRQKKGKQGKFVAIQVEWKSMNARWPTWNETKLIYVLQWLQLCSLVLQTRSKVVTAQAQRGAFLSEGIFRKKPGVILINWEKNLHQRDSREFSHFVNGWGLR